MDGIKGNGYLNIRKNRKGFTLVELIVVLVIIAILAALAVPALFGFIDSVHKKQVISRAQTALSSTQAALSDIYASNDNKYTVEKREQTRLNAKADETTAFTVWNVRPLYDEPQGENAATVAVTDEIGSYTVGKAVYKDSDADYAAYNGSEWDVYATEAEANAAAGVTSEDDAAVIYVWPYEDLYCDNALKPDGPGKEDPNDDEPDEPEALASKTVTLWKEPKGRALFGQGEDEQEFITVIFYKDEEGNVTTDWNWKDTDNSFTKNLQKLVLKLAKPYLFRYWQEKNGDYTAKGKNEIASYIFGEDKEGVDHFDFEARVLSDPNSDQVATLSNDVFSKFVGRKSVTDMVQVKDEGYTLEYVTGTLKATLVDDKSTERRIYAWFDGSTLKWWTDALVAYMPADCSNMLSSKDGLEKFSFSGFDTSKMENAESMFAKSQKLTQIDFGDEFIAPKLTYMKEMFRDCTAFTSLDLSGIQELGEYVYLEDTFRWLKNATSITLGDGFKKTKPKTLEGTFRDNKVLESLDLSGWDVSHVLSCDKTFLECNKITKIDFGSEWDLKDCTTLYGMFFRCSALDQDMHELKTTDKLVNMAECFGEMLAVTKLDMSGIDPSNVENFRSTFKKDPKLTDLDLSAWKGDKRPDKVRIMRQTFSQSKLIKVIDMSGWNLSNIENMCQTFSECESAKILTDGWNSEELRPKNGKLYTMQQTFNACKSTDGVIDLSGWDTSGLSGTKQDYDGQSVDGSTSYGSTEDAQGTFNGCKSIEGLILKNWDLSKATNLNNFMSDCKAVKVLDLTGWKVDTYAMGNNFINSCNQAERVILKDAHFTKLTSAKQFFNGFKKMEYVDLTGFKAPDADSAEAMFSSCESLKEVSMASAEFKSIKNMKEMFKNCYVLEKIDMAGVDTSAVTDMNGMFNGCRALKQLDMSGMKTPMVTKMNNMFNQCYVLEKLDMSGMDTSHVDDMSYMFSECKALKELNLSGMKTTKVTNMAHMFKSCNNLEALDVSKFDTEQVTNMAYMFDNCNKLELLDVSGFDTSLVSDMQYMFRNCSKIKILDVKDFDTSKVTSMTWMFGGCNELESVDVSSFDTAKVTDFGNMFNGCKAMKELDLSGFDVSSATYIWDIVSNMSSLEEIDITGWDMSGNPEKGVLKNGFLNGSRNSLKKAVLRNVNFGSLNSMEKLFQNCKKLETLNMSGVSANSVTSLYYLAQNCPKLKLVDLSRSEFNACTAMDGAFEHDLDLVSVNMTGIKTPSLVKPSWMFNDCPSLTEVDISDLDMAKATEIDHMFSKCPALRIVTLARDLDTTSITTKCELMFNEDKALTTINVYSEKADLSRFANTSVFGGCINIKGGKGTQYQGERATYGRVDKDGQPGYFTLITSD